MSGNSKVLIVDDDELVLLSLKMLMEQNGLLATTTASPERIPALLGKDSFQTILLDMNFRQGDSSSTQGLFWLKRIKERAADIPVIMITAFGEISLAVEAMKSGAHDFVTKPWENDKLMATVKEAVTSFYERHSQRHVTTQQRIIERTLDQQYESLIGDSKPINEIKKLIDKVSLTDTTVLISGENGTGKEVIARAIHRQSARSTKPFVAVDLGSLSENIFESELFGHKKGAFTDAKDDRVGRFEAAEGGTIFLDEIGNLPLSHQSKLLSVLQNRTITKLGTNNAVPLNVRVICATNSNLRRLVTDGKFREDLYYRINTVEILVPSLIDRITDFELLTNHFLTKFKSKYEKTRLRISADVMDSLKKYRWPGNIRELQHAVERAVILADHDDLSLDDFGITRNQNSGDLIFDHLNLERLERWAISKAIEKHEGNVSHAALELGLSRGAMYRRMEKYGI